MTGLNVAVAAEASVAKLVPISTFLDGASTLSTTQKTLLVEQALVLMDLYVHLPLKRAMYAVDPVQRLRLLSHQLPGERAFHEEMISIFNSLRDLHTNYILPEPYRSATAALPFAIGEYFDAEERRYIVFATSGDDPDFRPGMPVTHWNGVPMERAVELNARSQAGGNAAAKHARGLQRLTVRPLMMSLPPDEEWVVVGYLDANGAKREKRFYWSVLVESDASGTTAGPELSEATLGYWTALGLDLENEAANRVSRKLFASGELKVQHDVLRFLERRVAVRGGLEIAGGPDFSKVSMMPDVFDFSRVHTAGGDLGRIKIKTFNVQDPGAFVAEFVRIAALLPQDRLIVDVRGNGGGNIIAGETLLQTLTSATIEPERLQFLNRPLVLQMAEAKPDWFGEWLPSLRRALTTGAVFSQGLPLLPTAAYNKIGRKYPGKVVLLTDAFCYSTTDIFAAGFRDHKIGPILGTMGNTGAGGANVFDWQLIAMLFQSVPDSPIRTPPLGASFRVAIRRTLRVGPNAGVELEDLGVEPDQVHRTTLRDVLEQSVDLYDHATALLERWPGS
jgi:Peptidase family S41